MKPREVYEILLSRTLVEASFSGEDREGQRDAISKNPNLSRRLAGLTLHHTVHLVGAERILHAYALPYTMAGIEVIGHGFNSTAIRDPETEEVRKIIRGSERLSVTERVSLVEEMKAQIAINESFHPEVTVPTTVEIAPSPILGKPTVQLVQPFVNGSSSAPDPREIIDFAERSLDEMLPTGYLPDVDGRGNLLYAREGGIRLVDTIPIDLTNTRVFGRCASKLYQMAKDGTH